MRIWKGQLVSMKDYADTMMGNDIEATGAMLTWLVTYAVQILKLYKVLSNGRPGYEIITGTG